jgi:hypothetical protein
MAEKSILIYNSTPMANVVDRADINNYLEKEGLLPASVVSANSEKSFSALANSMSNLALIIVTNHKNSTPYSEVADAERRRIIEWVENNLIPFEIISENQSVLTPAVIEILNTL